MLIGFSGWWTPYPDDDAEAKEHIRHLLESGKKQMTTRPFSPLYEKIRVGDKLDLWWKKRGQPAAKNRKYGTATCLSKMEVRIDSVNKYILVCKPFTGWEVLDNTAAKRFAQLDTCTSLDRFFEIFKSGRYININWGDSFEEV